MTNDSRMCLNVSPELKAKIKRLATEHETTSVGVIRRMASLFDLATEVERNGGRVVFRFQNGTEEVMRLL